MKSIWDLILYEHLHEDTVHHKLQNSTILLDLKHLAQVQFSLLFAPLQAFISFRFLYYQHLISTNLQRIQNSLLRKGLLSLSYKQNRTSTKMQTPGISMVHITKNNKPMNHLVAILSSDQSWHISSIIELSQVISPTPCQCNPWNSVPFRTFRQLSLPKPWKGRAKPLKARYSFLQHLFC